MIIIYNGGTVDGTDLDGVTFFSLYRFLAYFLIVYFRSILLLIRPLALDHVIIPGKFMDIKQNLIISLSDITEELWILVHQ